MSSDVFRRTGRGGAGNFFSKKDVEEAQEAQPPQDPEAQKPKSPSAESTAAASGPTYTRGGRGGAGNFQDAPTIDDSVTQEDVLRRTNAAVSASLAKPRAGGSSGRGGAGNWSSDDAAQRDKEEQDRRRLREIEAKITHDVEASLQMPGKTYHQHDREME